MAKRLGTLPFVKSVLKSFMAESGLEPRLLGPHLRITNAAVGKVDFELDITKDHTNRLKILHGVSYLSAGGKIGDKISVTAVCDKIGKTLAYTSITFRNSKGELAARGSHTKYVAQAWKAQEIPGPFTPPPGAEIDEEK
ncbi:Thioesterase/thiol ester dehydrase-isomerase [Hypoxylon fragiforme]|uniref:Thioesterase/thiol ester dehydrase-isomerase n=1 Tax=Hypoxylon fragiforme TaxID=63214 RepID=UPI0020C672FC|nr:Thioesterase/thiol ester dehydrase-isomerase [Hypoxylon fragiforme]KAI2607739.1 Thioesterase/thiol ester dehydrase-isomerase [Hypoxylon fragiforme]